MASQEGELQRTAGFDSLPRSGGAAAVLLRQVGHQRVRRQASVLLRSRGQNKTYFFLVNQNATKVVMFKLLSKSLNMSYKLKITSYLHSKLRFWYPRARCLAFRITYDPFWTLCQDFLMLPDS